MSEYEVFTFPQGSPEWLAHRRTTYNASEAGAMLGRSKYMSRGDLIRQYALGSEKEVSVETQSLFDRGHAYEDIARPWAENVVGDLIPEVASRRIDGLARALGASADGLTVDGTTVWEHKSLNAALAAALEIDEIPDEYHPQLEQSLLVFGAERALFMASNGDPSTACYAWYTSNHTLRAEIIAGWRQFEEDVKNYQHVETAAPAVGKAVMVLPSLDVTVVGEVKSSNLVVYKGAAMELIAAIKTDLKTDQDFADADAMVKELAKAEADLKRAKQSALSQTATIDELFKTIDEIGEAVRSKRLVLTNLVKSKKDTIRAEVVNENVNKFRLHVAGLVKRVGKSYVASSVDEPDFGAAISGRKTVKSLRDAAEAELAKGMIAANAVADRIQINLKALADLGTEYKHLFADESTLVVKAPEDMLAIAKARVIQHQEQERAKRAAAEKAEAEKIKKAEEAAAAKAVEDERRRAGVEAAQTAGLEALAALAKQQAAPVVVPDFQRIPPAYPGDPVQRTPSRIAPSKPGRAELVNVIAGHYSIGFAVALDWMRTTDWDADI